MTMPIDLVLVRHGQSEGNLAIKRSKRGDNSAFTEEFMRRHSSTWRLTSLGREQAQTAGEWIAQHVGTMFDRYYVSEYYRAMETAALLGLPDASWYREYYLRERDYGDIDVMPEEEKQRQFSEAMARHRSDGLFWIPPNGEPMVQASLRVDRVLNTLHRECADKRVIIVSHGEIMWLFRIRIERLTQSAFLQLHGSKDPKDKIHNCQVVQYTRRDPATGRLDRRVNWMRSVCPSCPEESDTGWVEIHRRRYSNEDLLAEVETVTPTVE